MLNDLTRNRLRDLFAAVAEDLLAREKRLSSVELTPGQHVCLEGDDCGNLALLLSGQARIYKLHETGREITLYRIGPGASCILTASCILSRRPFPAFAIIQDTVQAVVVPASLVRDLMNRSAAWREFVFGLIAERLGDIIGVLDEVAFGKLDKRLANYLLETAGKDEAVLATHQSLAADLGTSREVVTRLLGNFQNAGLLTAKRGRITLVNRAGLAAKTND